MSAPTLSFDILKAAVAGSAAAFRLTLRLEAVSPKVFPPTYEGGKYAEEKRRIPGHAEAVPCVLLDSVQSQANRMEAALQRAWERNRIDLPVIVVDLSTVKHPTLNKITSLQAPHRIADAILRDSLLEGTYFRESRVGKELDKLGNENANPLLRHCPTALLFGMWDSTYKRGGLGVKFARCIVSEIIGINVQVGTKAAIRMDPLQIKKTAVEAIYRSDEEFWTDDPKKAKQDKSKKPIKFGDGTPASVVHGNIPTKLLPGGFTIDEAEQTTVLSLPSIRRLRFPSNASGAEQNCQVYIAALGLLAATLAIEDGFSLRSRCELNPKHEVLWELLGPPGQPPLHYSLSAGEAIQVYNAALQECRKLGCEVETTPIELHPSEKFKKLITESLVRWATETEAD